MLKLLKLLALHPGAGFLHRGARLKPFAPRCPFPDFHPFPSRQPTGRARRLDRGGHQGHVLRRCLAQGAERPGGGGTDLLGEGRCVGGSMDGSKKNSRSKNLLDI